MKHTIIVAVLALTLCLSAGPCQIIPGETTTGERVQYQAMIEAKAKAVAEGDVLAADAIEADLVAFENKVLMRRAGPVTKLVAAIYPPAAPLAPALPVLLGFLGLPLVGDRGRAHFVKMLKAGVPLVNGPNGTRGIDWRLAAVSALRYLGPIHSEGGKPAAFAKEPSAQPVPTA